MKNDFEDKISWNNNNDIFAENLIELIGNRENKVSKFYLLSRSNWI